VVLCRVGGGSLHAFLLGSRNPHRSRPLISDPFRSAEICSFLGFRFVAFTPVVWGFFWCLCSLVISVLCVLFLFVLFVLYFCLIIDWVTGDVALFCG